MKKCRICENSKPVSEFGSHRGHADGLQNYCKTCRNALNRGMLTPEQKERKAANAKRYAFRRNVIRRETRYGITPETFAEMKEAQGGRCAICNSTETYEHKELCVDHDHATGEVRGLLCSRCNKALGGFRDDATLLASAIGYLSRETNRPAWQAARVEVQQQQQNV